jgi:hypothetical protein
MRFNPQMNEIYILGYKPTEPLKPFLRKKYIFWTLGSLFILGLLYGAAHLYVKHRIAQLLAHELPSKMQITYDDLSLSLISNHFSLANIKVQHKSLQNSASINGIEIKGLQYIKFLRCGNFSIENIRVSGVTASFFKNDTVKTYDTNAYHFNKNITIKHFQLSDADLQLIEKKNDSLLFSVDAINLELKKIKATTITIHNKIPFTYSSYTLTAMRIKTGLGPYENLGIDSLKADGAVVINGLEIKTKYSKDSLQKQITKERDWIHLKVPEINFSRFDFVVEQDSVQIEIPSVVLKSLNLEMYRNKLMPDNYTLKNMFGKSIRNLPFALTIPCLIVENGTFSYSELVEPRTKPGALFFTEITSVMKNLSSVGSKPLTIKNKAKLMGVAPIELDGSFYQENGKGLFKASGVISNFNSEKLNTFLKPNLRAEAKGTIDSLYFTISGDEFVSSGDLKMSYSDFSFVVLKKDRLGVNKFLTAIVNIFTKDGSKADESGFRYGEIKVERDPTKSFFNYLWMNLKDGILHTFTGNGKKESM